MSAYACAACGIPLESRTERCPHCGNRSVGSVTPIPPTPTPTVPVANVVSPNAGRRVRAILVGENSPRSIRVSTGLPEYDRFFGGGIVSGSVISIYGSPGAGKSSLALTLGAALEAQNIGNVLYVATEELAEEVNERAIRLEIRDRKRFWIQALGDYSVMAEAIEHYDPAFLIVDSAQALRCDDMDRGAAGSPVHMRELASRFVRIAKNESRRRIVMALVHITNEGDMAGPAFFKHMGDVVAELRHEPGLELRRLRLDKNRYGPTSESVLLEMTRTGLQPVPPGAFVADRTELPGSVVFAGCEGSRSLFLLISGMLGEMRESGNSRRIVVGIDPARVGIVSAVLDAYTLHKVGSRDVLLQVAGGASTQDATVDVAIALAILSSEMRVPVPGDIMACGEIGLGGEVRSVPRLDDRLQEAVRLGFQRAIVPAARNLPEIKGIELIPIRGIRELCTWMEAQREELERRKIDRRGTIPNHADRPPQEDQPAPAGSADIPG